MKTMAKLRMAHASTQAAWAKREKERAKVGDNNGQATHDARKHAWRTQAAWANLHPEAQCQYVQNCNFIEQYYGL